MARLRYGNQLGITGTALSSSTSGTTQAITNFFGSIPTLATINSWDYIAVIIEPDSPNEEIVWLSPYTSGSQNATIVRGKENTAATAHAAGVQWKHGPTVTYDIAPPFLDAINYNQATPSLVFDDEFDLPPLSSKWQRIDAGNSSAVTWAQGRQSLSMIHTGGDASSATLHGLVQPMTGLTTPPVAIDMSERLLAPDANYSMVGLVFADGVSVGSGTQVTGMHYVYSGSWYYLVPYQFINWNTEQTYPYSAHWKPWGLVSIHHRLVWRATNNFEYWMSADGEHWFQYASSTYTMTPTYFGFVTTTWGGNITFQSIFDYFRVHTAGI